ncbi:MAG: YqaJ viral recombinase family protein [Spiribacter salinus]|uniref:YqaJ viral recombinase family protein n=1 Tax=Spiribacter salinus TaxID=1335746 RepID=A0A540VPT3_9GAMM|nr:MAG: YqaJ viral recombinase family protein [Spiribacter salinus]
MIIYRDIEQGTEEWLRVRAGVPTASQFDNLLAGGDGKVRKKYMLKLAGEILTGEPQENFSTRHTRRGHEQEPEARETYAFLHDVDVEQVGFIRNGDVGGSPDGLVGDNGGVEIKTKLPHLHLEVMLDGIAPEGSTRKYIPPHLPQIDGLIWIAEREWWDLVSYCRGLEPFITRVYRDEKRIKKIAQAVDQFNQELTDVLEKVRRGSAPLQSPSHTTTTQTEDLKSVF